jgi:hypothetical protein
MNLVTWKDQRITTRVYREGSGPAPVYATHLIGARMLQPSGRGGMAFPALGVSGVVDSVFACPGTVSSRHLPRKRRWLEHCGHARFVWNLAVEQHRHWRPGRKSAPGFTEQCRQLTEAREAFGWLRAGSVIVQQQALKDFAQAMANFFGGTHRRPTWRKAGRHEGFRIVAVKIDRQMDHFRRRVVGRSSQR